MIFNFKGNQNQFVHFYQLHRLFVKMMFVGAETKGGQISAFQTSMRQKISSFPHKQTQIFVKFFGTHSKTWQMFLTVLSQTFKRLSVSACSRINIIVHVIYREIQRVFQVKMLEQLIICFPANFANSSCIAIFINDWKQCFPRSTFINSFQITIKTTLLCHSKCPFKVILPGIST